MAVTILEALQNAKHNLGGVRSFGTEFLPLVESQLNNAVTLLEKGYNIGELIEPLLEKYGDVKNVPEVDIDVTDALR